MSKKWQVLRAEYLSTLFAGVDITPPPAHLQTGSEDLTMRPFAIIAFHLHSGDSFEEIVGSMQQAINEEVEHDGPEVMNMVGVLAMAREKEVILRQVAVEMSERLQKAQQVLLDAEYDLPGNPEEVFKKIFWQAKL